MMLLSTTLVTRFSCITITFTCTVDLNKALAFHSCQIRIYSFLFQPFISLSALVISPRAKYSPDHKTSITAHSASVNFIATSPSTFPTPVRLFLYFHPTLVGRLCQSVFSILHVYFPDLKLLICHTTQHHKKIV